MVFCTGFEGNMGHTVAEVVGDEVAGKLDDYWCVGREGEVRGAWKPIGRECTHSLSILATDLSLRDQNADTMTLANAPPSGIPVARSGTHASCRAS